VGRQGRPGKANMNNTRRSPGGRQIDSRNRGNSRVTAAVVCAAVFILWNGPLLAQGGVGGTGTLMPSGGVINIVGPAGGQINLVMAQPYSEVKEGDVLIVLSNRNLLEAERKLAEQESEALSRKSSDAIRLQELAVDAAMLEVKRANRELRTYNSLAPNARSTVESNKRKFVVEEARHRHRVEKLKLAQLTKEIEIKQKRAELRKERAEARLMEAFVLAPRDGTVLDVLKRAGETLGNGPAIILGDLRTMYAVSDVYEGDLVKVKEGMKGTVKSESLNKTLTGVVERIGRLVDNNTRLAKVMVRLNEPDWARQFVGMKVRVTIHTK
jgi:multidrug resistance efflux pump